MTHSLSHLKVAVIATDGFEEAELLEPVKALRDAGAQVEVLSNHSGKIQAFRHFDKGEQVTVDRTLDKVTPDEFHALLLPGGALNADFARSVPEIRSFVRSISEAGKPLAVICHAPWILVSANLVRGRTLTGYHTIQDDIRNAGGNWVDQEVVVDQNWVTSRQPKDIPEFTREMIRLFERSIQRPPIERKAG